MGGPIYIFAGGGTGGHVYPGVAVAGELGRIVPRARVIFACSNRAIDRRVLDPLPYGVVVQPIRTMPRSARGWGAFGLSLIRSAGLAREMLRNLQPAAVLGLGGFAAWPVVSRASRRGVATALLNPDAVPGVANRRLAGRVDAIFTQFESTGDAFGPSTRGKIRVVGCPVRSSFLTADRDEAMRHFHLNGELKTLLVNGGSLGAASINRAFEAIRDEMDDLSHQWQVLHITGECDSQPAETCRAGGMVVRTLGYCRRMDLAYSAADLVLGRCGASSAAELSATGTPAVLMPYPHHADRQQFLNAASLVERGAAIVCEDRIIDLRIANAIRPWRIALRIRARFTRQSSFGNTSVNNTSANAAALRGTLLGLMRDAAALEAMRQSADMGDQSSAAEQVARWLAKHS